MSSTLPTLAIEVIETIASTLDQTSLGSVRLVCKDLNRKTLHYFGRTYFTRFKTDLSHNSLLKLESISRNEQLKNLVQSLSIKGNEDLGRGFHWHRAKESNLSSHIDTRISLGVQMLRNALTEMVNCRSFRIQSLGGMEEYYGSEYLLPSDAIGIILSIVAEDGTPLKSFHIDFGSRGSVDAKRLQMQLYQQPTFIAAWKNLEELHFEHYLTSETLDWARDLVLHTLSLKKLSLRFNFDHSTLFVDSLLSSPARFQGLHELKLGSIYISADMLSTLLLSCRDSLRRLSFWHVRIQSGAWVQILTALITFRFLEDIVVDWPKECRNEETIHLQFPKLDINPVVPGCEGRKFELRYKQWKGKRRVWGASFHERVGMDKALEVLVETVEDT